MELMPSNAFRKFLVKLVWSHDKSTDTYMYDALAFVLYSPVYNTVLQYKSLITQKQDMFNTLATMITNLQQTTANTTYKGEIYGNL